MKFDLLFEVQVPRPWDARTEQTKIQQSIEQAVFAEQMGFDTIWYVEHHFLTEFAHSSAPEVILGALTQRTSRIRLGHGVTLLPGKVNHPIRVAERSATIDILSDGRFEQGTGRSSSPYQLEAFGVDVASTREQWEESLKLLPQLWTQEDFAYKGTHWSWEDRVNVIPKPVQKPHPPLWVASTQPDTCRLAGEKGIGLLMSAIAPPETFAAQIREYKAAIKDPIDQIGMFKNDCAAPFTVMFCHEDEDTARRVGGPAGLWYIDTINEIYKNDWRGVPLEAVPDSYRHHAQRKLEGRLANTANEMDAMKDVSAEERYTKMIDIGAFCVGDPASLRKKVQQYKDAGGDRLVLVNQVANLSHEDLLNSIELFGRKVAPHFREAPAPAAAGAPAS